MTQLPQAASYRADPAILELGDAFYDPVEAADFPRTVLRFRNDRWAPDVGLAGLPDSEWIRHFARFEPLADNLSQPLALRYHGHQFRSYNPDIGDGRGFLFAQLRDSQGRLLDLGTKGSGQTPYSRFGDGRLTLKGGVREVLATEMLEALGVETSKTFSLIETGEALERNDEPSPTRSAVLVRLQHSHIRIGAFQRLAYFQEAENLAKLTDYCLRHYYGGSELRHCEEPFDAACGGAQDELPLRGSNEAVEAPKTPEAGLLRSARNDGPPAARLLAHVAREAARLAASYIAAGFVHGVLNSDNIAITAQSFDYGPWRFTPYWDGHFTAAYFDHAGLYSFGRQPEAIHWDVLQLAASLQSIAEVDDLNASLDAFPPEFQRRLVEAMFGRLGIRPAGGEGDARLLVALETALTAKTVTIDRFFFDWRGGRRRAPSPADNVYESDAFADFRNSIALYDPAEGALDHEYWLDEAPCSMHVDEVEAIWSRIDESDDWSLFEDKIGAIRRMGEAMRPGA
ncbi:MAG TPA: protein adenylyltransferase SelO family protein [Allosphingosinicella sp.]|nr:protein adenylyltransferase SelO family protein [Allosphingosinicella sp.]